MRGQSRVKGEKLAPSGRPVQLAILRAELLHTVRQRAVLGQQKLVDMLGRDIGHRTRMMGGQRSNNKAGTATGVRTNDLPPSRQQFTIERGQKGRMKRRRVSQDSIDRDTKMNGSPPSQMERRQNAAPTARARRQPSAASQPQRSRQQWAAE